VVPFTDFTIENGEEGSAESYEDATTLGTGTQNRAILQDLWCLAFGILHDPIRMDMPLHPSCRLTAGGTKTPPEIVTQSSTGYIGKKSFAAFNDPRAK
jgi:hypothetical protein